MRLIEYKRKMYVSADLVSHVEIDVPPTIIFRAGGMTYRSDQFKTPADAKEFVEVLRTQMHMNPSVPSYIEERAKRNKA